MNIQGAASALQIALGRHRIPYLLVGRYAIETACIGGATGPTSDSSAMTLNVLVDMDKDYIADVLVSSGEAFGLTSAIGLVFDPDVGYVSADPIYIDIIESGEPPYYFPSAAYSPGLRLPINAIVEVYILHPALLVISTVRLWSVATKDYSKYGYVEDSRALLYWLAERKITIAFEFYEDLPKSYLLMTFASLYAVQEDIRGLLELTMNSGDFAAIRDNRIPY
ncbi:hypothetical protein LOZ53_006454 [Ophidiomyces ophidiicola]|uniref:Uncharacterized protein n=1 Tax=Ophidiomyces ophidiicola TaxID=1387563 RepID=A0ACB8V0C4_9EURO|nr:uncharacterized protein LOZ57_000504 [Ophidiomyces ophidiicola]KAI1907542.1 hypothetical protein LOZ61_006089 [Ophidiomyces ophidiicola]KAI1922795.1 hypothetical protein LOZ60_005563 [Ophidiomyces ophidiicola]KAI1936700.1 hypothetical protein LOZ62_005667 [Ophidiomyces ophidiicola]KAI1954154.1 hypothetical protein LOZ57_000504 [Ophidiomyces ophidiicola]KAI1960068.1 hypothetical protein LOZ59_002883 [Ophidiomyces ophidiicola]